MLSDADENLHSVPSTPTTNVSSLSDTTSAFEAIDMESSSAASPVSDDLVQHSIFFYHEPMVTIQVEKTLFRIPRNFLTKGSNHFAQCLGPQDGAYLENLRISDLDITSSAFENLLLLLHPPEFGVVPISTLAQWTDVLHLSDKWGFMSLRAAAIKAILPLASSVDKIVLGKQYGFEEWLAPSYKDLITREKRLTKEESYRLGIDIVLAIVEGRERAWQVRCVEPPAMIDKLVGELFPAQAKEDCPLSVHDIEDASFLLSASPSITPADALTTEEQRSISRWVEQSLTSHTAIVGRSRLQKHLREVPHHHSAAVATFLGVFWTSHHDYWTRRLHNHGGHWSSTQKGPDNTAYMLDALRELKRDAPASCVDEAIKMFCLNKLSAWTELLLVSPKHDSERLLNGYDPFDQDKTSSHNLYQLPDSFFHLASATHCTRYILDRTFADPNVFSTSVFANFWTRMVELCKQMWNQKTHLMAKRLEFVIKIMSGSVFTNAACVEIEAFYDHIENLCLDNASSSDPFDVKMTRELRSKVLNTRQWPQD